jgi:hypothetical protein
MSQIVLDGAVSLTHDERDDDDSLFVVKTQKGSSYY